MLDGADEVPPGVQIDREGQYDGLFFRVGGGIAVAGVAVATFFLYDGPHAEESLAVMAGVARFRLEGVLVGAGIVLLGLLVAVGGPILSRELA